MQGIYNYVPETNHASRVYNFVVILYLLFMAHVNVISSVECFVLLHKYFIIIIIIIIIIVVVISCHRPFLPGTSLEPEVIPTTQASSFTLQYFPFYV